MIKFKKLIEKDDVKIGDTWLSKDRKEVIIKDIIGNSISIYSKDRDKIFTVSKDYFLDNYIN